MVEDDILSKLSFVRFVVILKASQKFIVNPHILSDRLIKVDICIESGAGNITALGLFRQASVAGTGIWRAVDRVLKQRKNLLNYFLALPGLNM